MAKKSTKVGAKASKNYGWKPDLPDHRDHVYGVMRTGPLPTSVDLRAMMPPVYDQGQLGSCTGNAIAAGFSFAKYKETSDASKTFFTPSRLFIYYGERVVEHTVSQDAGAQIRDGIKVVAQRGVCSEKTWPYNIAAFKKKPTPAAFAEGLLNQAVSYERVPQTADAMKTCLASGFPVIFGFTVYEAFESDEVAKTGILNMPTSSEKSLGGHAVLCVGFLEKTKQFIVRNSWGDSWGQHGYFLMPYQYLLNANLADDLWTIRTTE